MVRGNILSKCFKEKDSIYIHDLVEKILFKLQNFMTFHRPKDFSFIFPVSSKKYLCILRQNFLVDDVYAIYLCDL